MADQTQDIFISHAGSDKTRYLEPLVDRLTRKGITFWLDNVEIAWGDSVPLRINEGLQKCRFLLLCLSRSFLGRPWPEAEMAAALAIQNGSGQKRILPLILDSKELVLGRYPLLASLAYREYTNPPDALVEELVTLVGKGEQAGTDIHVIVESVHTGQLCNIHVSPKVSIRWLADQAQRGLGLSEFAQTGAYTPFKVKWVLVDVKAEDHWTSLPRHVQRRLRAVVSSKDGPKLSQSDRDRLEDIGVDKGMVFHLYAIEDEDYGPPPAAAPPGRW